MCYQVMAATEMESDMFLRSFEKEPLNTELLSSGFLVEIHLWWLTL